MDESSDFAARTLAALDALPLEVLYGMPLECDGVSNALSQALLHVGMEHEIQIGRLNVTGVGDISLHWWVVLKNGAHCDIRARMWLGNEPHVPHGVFHPLPEQQYRPFTIKEPSAFPTLFQIITSQELEAFVAGVLEPGALKDVTVDFHAEVTHLGADENLDYQEVVHVSLRRQNPSS